MTSYQDAELFFNGLIPGIPGAKPGRMFGAACMKMPNGKSGAMLWRDFLVVKLTGDALTEAMSLDGSKEFEPMEGRVMKGWVQVPFTYRELWKGFAELSAASAALAARRPRKAKR